MFLVVLKIQVIHTHLVYVTEIHLVAAIYIYIYI